jgi:flagellar hook-length control protein FliK
MEQVGLQTITPESTKHQFIGKNEMKSLWNSKKDKKGKAKDFFQFIKALSAGIPTNKIQLKGVNLQVPKVRESKENKENVEKLHSNPVIVVKKKIDAIKKDSNENEAHEIHQKNGKTKPIKDKKNDHETIVPDLVKAFLQPSKIDEKKMKSSDNRLQQSDENGPKQKVSDSPDTSKKTVVIDLRKINPPKNEQNTDSHSTNTDISGPVKTSGPNNDSMIFFGTSEELKAGNKGIQKADNPAALASQDNIDRFRQILDHELVNNTRFILRDGGGGEIQIELKPESLGKLKFKVNLENNRIDGKIFVENDSIRELVEQSIQNLSHTLLDEGFASVNLQVSVGGDNKKNPESYERMQGGSGRSNEPDYSVPSLERLDLGDSTVNVMV